MDNNKYHPLTHTLGDVDARARRESAAWAMMDTIGTDVLTRLQTRNFQAHGDVAPILTFEALLLPFRRSDGKRATGPRWLTVEVTDVGHGLFDMLVFGYEANRYRGHARVENIHAECLGRTVAGLDYAGPEVLDPAA